jgi:histone H3/H4
MALFVKSAVRSQLKGMRASGDFFKALDKHLAAELAKAVARAKENGRKTCRGCDL